MAWYPVRNDGGSNVGTRTSGSFGTKPTGSWASAFPNVSDYYASVKAAIDAGAGSDDDIICADDHNNNHGATLQWFGPRDGRFLRVSSVDVTNVEVFKAGAKEGATGGTYSFQPVYAISLRGVVIDVDRDITNSGSIFYRDCTLNLATAGGTRLFSVAQGSNVRLENTDLDWNIAAVGSVLNIDNRGNIWWRGGTVTAPANMTQFVRTYGGTGYFEGLTLDDAGFQNLLVQRLASDNVHSVPLIFKSIVCNAALGMDDGGGITGNILPIISAQCGPAGAASGDQGQTYYKDCTAKIDTTISRQGSTPLASGNNFSIKISTSDWPSQTVPFTFDVPTTAVDLSAAGSDVLEFYLVTDGTDLTDLDIALELRYPDNTNPSQANTIDSLSTGTAVALATDSGNTWDGVSGFTTPKYWKISLDTSGDQGGPCMPSLRAHVAKENLIAYLCPTPGLS